MIESGPRASVLCVDDEPMAREFVVRCLFDEFHVVTADSGNAGLELLQQFGTFAVVIADLSMPGMSGSTFLAEVRVRAPQVARIMLTGLPHVGGAEQATREGTVFRFLTKPCAPNELIEAVRDAAAHHRSLTRRVV